MNTRSHIRWIVALSMSALPGASLAAVPVHAEADTLRLARVLAMSREANPALQAARLQADAAAERVPQAGAFPDPQLAFGLMNRPIGGFGSAEPMTMNSVQLTQVLPWPGKLGPSEERFRRLAQAERLDAFDAEVTLLARVAAVYYRLAYVDRAIGIMEETRDLLRSFLEVSTAMYGVGTGLQQDVLQAQVAVARMTEEITVMGQDRVGMAARLNALLGREADAPVGALELPSALADSLPPVGVLMDRAAVRRPALAAVRARVQAAEAGYRAARRELYPDIMLAVSYGQRSRFDDMVTLMAGFSIPLWAGSRQLPVRREMRAMQAMEEARSRDLWNETYARLAELRAEADRARRLTALYGSSVLPQARSAVQSALAAYRVGRVPYMTLVENQMTVNRYAIENIRLAADYLGAVAEIEALLGGELGGGR